MKLYLCSCLFQQSETCIFTRGYVGFDETAGDRRSGTGKLGAQS